LGDSSQDRPDRSSQRIALDMRTTTHEVAIEICGLNKWFGHFHVLREIDLKVMRGERIVICGPSGSGKSTLLRCINRIEDWQPRSRHCRWHRAHGGSQDHRRSAR
jgi:ABC-type transporter Mla maintaining outer membrane lipid asymmetry ATPase subunit MlaF